MKNRNILMLTFSVLLFALVASFSEVKAQSDINFTEPEKVYNYAEQMPEFEGGQQAFIKFLADNVKYPETAKKAETEGLAAVSFIVEKDGTLSNIEIKKSAGTALDLEAIRVLELTSGKWKAGKQNGKPVKVKLTAPVKFSASKE